MTIIKAAVIPQLPSTLLLTNHFPEGFVRNLMTELTSNNFLQKA